MGERVRDHVRLSVGALGFSLAYVLSLHWAMVGMAPRAAILVSLSGCLAPLLVWGFLLLYRVSTQASAERLRADELMVFTICVLGAVHASWRLLPWASPPIALVIVLFGLSSAPLFAQWSARSARMGWIEFLLPAMFPIGLAAFLLRSPALSNIIAAMTLLGYAALFMGQRRMGQKLFEDLRQAQSRAEAERDARARFVASASHDLGQPLHSARLFLDQALEAREPAERERLAERARWAMGVSQGMLRRLIDHLRLEGDEAQAVLRPVAAGELISRTISLYEAEARLAGIALRTVSTRAIVIGERELLERALGNLVSNAVRHSRGKRVLIGARPFGQRWRLWVIDDGLGLGSGATARSAQGGHGLGLASVRRIAELHGGKLVQADGPHDGAAFCLELSAA